MFNFLQYGTTAQVARATGAGEDEIAARLGAQCLWLSLGFGAPSRSRSPLLAAPVVDLFGAEGATADYAVTYLASLRSASRPRSSRSAGRGSCAASPTCGRRS